MSARPVWLVTCRACGATAEVPLLGSWRCPVNDEHPTRVREVPRRFA